MGNPSSSKVKANVVRDHLLSWRGPVGFSSILFTVSLLSSLTASSLGKGSFPVQSRGEINFTVDAARFRLEKERTYLELYYEIPFQELSYREEEGRQRASLRVMVRLSGPEGEGIVDTVERASYVPSLEEARRRALSALDQYEVYPLSSGEYELSLEIVDLDSGRKGEVRERILIEPSSKQLTLSDLQLARGIEPDTSEGPFTKRGLRVTPNPSRKFGFGRELLYAYSEVYNVKGEACEVEYSIYDEEGSLVKKLPARSLATSGPVCLEVGALNVIALAAGKYVLRMEVRDEVDSAFTQSSFTILESPPERRHLAVSDKSKEYYQLIEYLATPKELQFYQSLSDSAREEYLVSFWQRRDPVPESPLNEALEEFAQRVIDADSDYGSQFTKGRDTDRGRIYVKYGRPDEVERRPTDLSYKPYESWLYYAGGGKQFVFVDLSGYGNYELLYSSEQAELTDPEWDKYVDPSVIQVQRR